jgi:CRP/FNR family cyclic AMP-dependent transcriptional regulator
MAVSSPDLNAFLVATPFFGGLSDASLDLLISMLVERRFDVGATVVAEGEPGRSMYIVHSGKLVVSKLGESGRAIRMTGLGPGDFFGEMTLIEVQNRSATVVAESPTVLYELTARNLYTYYKADIYAAQAFRGAKLNYCTPFRWSQFLLNPQDARDSASLTPVKHLPARHCGGAADKARD